MAQRPAMPSRWLWRAACTTWAILALNQLDPVASQSETPKDETQKPETPTETPKDKAHGAEDPEDLPGGEMHLGADDGPLEMLTHDQMRTLHGKIDQNGDGDFSVNEALEYADRLAQQDGAHEVLLAVQMDDSKDGMLSLEELIKGDDIIEAMRESNPKDLEDFTQEELERAGRTESELKRLRFGHADENADGLLDETELGTFYNPFVHRKAQGEAAMKQKDKDGDGYLTKVEFFNEPHSQALVHSESELAEEELKDFAELDEDGSGYLDEAELSVWESGRFHTKGEINLMIGHADKDNNGKVSVDEFLAARNQINGTHAMYHLLEWGAHEEL